MVTGLDLAVGYWMLAAWSEPDVTDQRMSMGNLTIRDMLIHFTTDGMMSNGTNSTVPCATPYGHTPLSGIAKDVPKYSDDSLGYGAMMDGECAPQSAQGLCRAHCQTCDITDTYSSLQNSLAKDACSLQAEATAALPVMGRCGSDQTPHLNVVNGG